MSVTATKWAWDQARAGRVPGNALSTLLAWADQANEEGYGWIGLAIIVDMTNQGYRTVQRHTSELERLGLMERHRKIRRSGRLGKYEYWLAIQEQPLLDRVAQPRRPATGQIGRSGQGGSGKSESTPQHAAPDGDHDHRPNATTGQNGHWSDLAGQPPANLATVNPVKHKTQPSHLRACACVREGNPPADHEQFVAFATSPYPDDAVTYCTADLPEWEATFPDMPREQIAQTLREIGSWYRNECRNNPDARKARLAHEWHSRVRRWLGETLQDLKQGKTSPAKARRGMTENFEGKHYEGDDDAEEFFATGLAGQ